MKLYYIANARIPHKKAYAIQIAKMCEAFVEEGADLELIIPRQRGVADDIKDYYKLRTSICVKRMPALNFYASGKLGFFFSGINFMLFYSLYLFSRVLFGKRGVVYTTDMDTFSFVVSPYFGMPCFLETHGGKAKTFINTIFFKRVKGIIVINNIIKKQIKRILAFPEDKIIVEPNGIDLELFRAIPRDEARRALSLPKDRKIVMYCGRFYGWKGLEVLADAVAMLPNDIFVYIVGGTKEEFTDVIKREDISANFIFPGEQPYAQIPFWLSAADGLLVLGTKHDNQSYYYTSPMKIFEYMAVERPIIASKTPAIQDILLSEEAVFYEPDNASDLADKICLVANSPESACSKVVAACLKVKELTWRARARKIIRFIEEKTKR